MFGVSVLAIVSQVSGISVQANGSIVTGVSVQAFVSQVSAFSVYANGSIVPVSTKPLSVKCWGIVSQVSGISI